MTEQEFSNEFDILYNNIMSNQAPGLDEYEKSVFLTQAQEEFIIGVYSGRLLQSFEETEEIRRYLDSIVKTQVLTSGNYSLPVSDNSKFFTAPEDLWFIVSEYAKLEDNNKHVDVVPITHDAFLKVRNNPFKKDNKRRALRLGQANSEGLIEIISNNEIKDYTIKYISKPDPIIIGDLYGTNLSIDDKTDKMACKLNPVTHRYILKLAVELAAKAYKN